MGNFIPIYNTKFHPRKHRSLSEQLKTGHDPLEVAPNYQQISLSLIKPSRSGSHRVCLSISMVQISVTNTLQRRWCPTPPLLWQMQEHGMDFLHTKSHYLIHQRKLLKVHFLHPAAIYLQPSHRASRFGFVFFNLLLDNKTDVHTWSHFE